MNTTVTGAIGGQLPNLEAHGLARKMKEAHRLITEEATLTRRVDELGAESQQLEEEIRNLEYEHTREWGAALRAGEEAPSVDKIEQAKKRLEEVTREIAAVREAAALADAELKAVVVEHAAEWDALVQAQGEAILLEAQQMADALSRKLSETEGLVGLHSWLTSGGQFYTPVMAGSVSIDNLIHERMHVLGLLDAQVVG